MNQLVLEGKESLNQIPIQLKAKGVERVLLVTGKNSYIKSSANILLQPSLANFSTTRFFDFEENPKLEDVIKGIKIFQNNNCQAILAVGGGSVIDMAKLIKAYNDVDDNISSKIIKNEVGNCTIDLIVVPTTAGSGSEATHFAVVYINDKKYSVANKEILPSSVFLLPELTLTTSSYLTAVTGLDAFSQAIESWWSVNSTKESINYSKLAIELIWNNLPLAVVENDIEAKKKMLKGAHLAGKAINITKTTAPHALSYGFTTHCGLPHGHAVAIFLPAFIDMHIEVNDHNCNDKRGKDWIIQVMNDLAYLLNADTRNLPQEVVSFINRCKITINFTSLKISETLYVEAINSFSLERLNNNPIKIELSSLYKLYNSKLNNA